ncbi:class I SAM-dependent methyltransferase [Pseudoalteromonas sp. JBTF-M23]|uniref:Class I SAM-dependent methyltransferase n=1 Tax=Pseudoalteromonas caenipelagi TaxID=2726988 RepID=A0A849V7S9_9GAMM|nr:class I SAM-dependent methyltransferase [Pseudoalteromonas caenipelagi]NOU49609.1 class I SAM-dependent methyltransferase [Pseudoalteromonas caenipelagi]
MKTKSLSALLGCALLASSAAYADIYDDAVANSARSKKDRTVDERRKPEQVMRFFEIQPSMKVLDVFAGGGYYSELMSYVVGERGHVTMYNNQPWQQFVKKAVDERLKDNRLQNVSTLIVKPEELAGVKEQFDAAIFVLGMHDLYYEDSENGWPKIDRAKFLQGIYSKLKSGAVFGVIDANAKTGVDNAVIGKTIHRVDPAAVIKDIKAVGFVLEAQGEFLGNAKDDLTTSVFLPENRYNTDRSVLKFRKP